VVSGEPRGLASAIAQLLADPAARQEMGRRGAEAARSRLSWPGIAADVERLYREILRQKAELAAAA
jgi:glycosyltransferase involved in cell wall biosynthesis